MTSQSSSSPERRTLYHVDGVDDGNAITPELAPSPTSASHEDESPVFRIDHPLYEHEDRAGWLADQLLMPGAIFYGKVHVAGDKTGKKQPRQTGGSTQVTYATFTSVIGNMLQQSASVEDVCLPKELISDAILQGPNSLSHQKVEQGGQLLAGLYRHYWRAVATAYAEAWDDPHEHVLWHPHGLSALARLGGIVVEDQVAAYDIRQHYFDDVLERVADSVSLAKAEYEKVPARELSDHLFTVLSSAREATGPRRAGLAAVPGAESDISWDSAPPSPSPPVASPPVESMPIGPEN